LLVFTSGWMGCYSFHISLLISWGLKGLLKWLGFLTPPSWGALFTLPLSISNIHILFIKFLICLDILSILASWESLARSDEPHSPLAFILSTWSYFLFILPDGIIFPSRSIASSYIISIFEAILSLNTIEKSTSKAPTCVTLVVGCEGFISPRILLYNIFNLLFNNRIISSLTESAKFSEIVHIISFFTPLFHECRL